MRRLLLIAVVAVSLTGCAQLSRALRSNATPPTATYQSTSLSNISLDDATVEATFAVRNPNAIGLKLEGLDWAFSFDGQQVFDGKFPTGLQLPANGTTLLKVPITVPFKALPSLFTTFSTKNEAPYTVKARASVRTPIGTIGLPLGWEGMLPVPKMPKVSLGTARVESLTLTGARVMVQFALENPNTFALPLEALGGQVKVSGQQVAGLTLAKAQALTAGKTTTVQMPIDISFASVGFAVANALSSGNATLAVDGQAKVGGKSLPMNLKTTLTR